MQNNEIFLNNIMDLSKQIKNLTQTNWINISSKYLNNIYFIICKTKCEVFKGIDMILDDSVKIYLKNIDSIFNSCIIPLDMLEYYIKLLINQKYQQNIIYIRNLMQHQLKINDIINFNNDKKGIILPPNKIYNGILHYKLIKKDGSLGIKNLILYGDAKCKIQDREFISYNKD